MIRICRSTHVARATRNQTLAQKCAYGSFARHYGLYESDTNMTQMMTSYVRETDHALHAEAA